MDVPWKLSLQSLYSRMFKLTLRKIPSLSFIVAIVYSFIHVRADIQRTKDGFSASFTEIRKGGLVGGVLDELDNTDIDYCMYRCAIHRKCKTINFDHESRTCQIIRKDYEEAALEHTKSKWYNYGTKSTNKGNPCKKYDKSEGALCSTYDNKMTISFSHDKEEEIYSSGYENNFHDIRITYDSSVKLIESVVTQNSFECVQSFYVESKAVSHTRVKFVSTNGNELNAFNPSCLNCKSLFPNRLLVIAKGYGNITDSNFLPLRSVLIGDTGEKDEYAKITLKKLVCTKDI